MDPLTQVHKHIEPDEQPRPSRVKEFGLRVIIPQGGVVIEQFIRTPQGFHSLKHWSFEGGDISESELQDIVTSLTKTFLEELITAQGVRLVPPL